jgi:hypothetical protein
MGRWVWVEDEMTATSPTTMTNRIMVVIGDPRDLDPFNDFGRNLAELYLSAIRHRRQRAVDEMTDMVVRFAKALEKCDQGLSSVLVPVMAQLCRPRRMDDQPFTPADVYRYTRSRHRTRAVVSRGYFRNFHKGGVTLWRD